MSLKFPNKFVDTITRAYGNEGKKWLTELAEILKKCEILWDIKIEPSSFELSYNYVTKALKNDGSLVVVKVGFPNEKELFTEMEALEYFNGRHIVELIEKEIEFGAMVQQMVTPGTTLKEIQKLDDEEATKIAAPIIRDLPIPVPKNHSLPSIADWALVLQRVYKAKSLKPITIEMLDRALCFYDQLENTKTQEMLLHGDLHHENILYDDKRGWLAIDPKGLIGDPAFNGARFIQNFWQTTPTASLVMNRVNLISSICELDKQRIAKWAYIDYIISNAWALEENRIPTLEIDYINALESIIQ